jgi:DNA-binding PadR family transcriptional regulator
MAAQVAGNASREAPCFWLDRAVGADIVDEVHYQIRPTTMGYEGCPCTGISLDRMLRPTVMAMLVGERRGLHGYLIAQRLQKVAIFRDAPPDNTGLYRLLKDMQEEGYLRARWDLAKGGPARRRYALTAKGRRCLRRWKETLETYSLNLKRTLRFIRQADRCARAGKG